jgi:hypothetical protein
MRVLSVCLLAVTACSHPLDRDLTAPEHRDLADLHQERAAAERKKYDPSLTRESIANSPFTGLPDQVIEEYNPTAGHLAEADRELKSAAAHDRAAEKLEEFENDACRGLPTAVRAACPLLASQVELVQNDTKGVRLTLKPEVDARDVEARLQCHLAYARANGFDRPTCPLFVRGMSIALQRSKVIVLHGNSYDAVQALQAQARRIFTGEGSPPVSLLIEDTR